MQRPVSSIRPSSGWAALNLRQVWQFRDLLASLAGRDIKLRYRQTLLGAVWVVLQPLLSAGILFFVFNKVAKLNTDFPSAFAGTIAFYVFNQTLNKCATCLVDNAGLVSKVFFPRLVLPFSTVLSTLVDFGVSLGVMIVLLLVYRIAPTLAFLTFPLWLGLILLLAMGIGLFAAALTVSYRDVRYVIPVLTQILTFASPVGYTLAVALEKTSARLHPFYLLNPLSSLLEGFRWAVLGTPPPPLNNVLYAVVFCVVIFIAGAFSFKKMERKFADVI